MWITDVCQGHRYSDTLLNLTCLRPERKKTCFTLCRFCSSVNITFGDENIYLHLKWISWCFYKCSLIEHIGYGLSKSGTKKSTSVLPHTHTPYMCTTKIIKVIIVKQKVQHLATALWTFDELTIALIFKDQVFRVIFDFNIQLFIISAILRDPIPWLLFPIILTFTLVETTEWPLKSLPSVHV